MHIVFWLTCPQIRFYGNKYTWSIWLWMRRKGQWPNSILIISRFIDDGYWESNYEEAKTLEQHRHWCFMKLRD